jgi:predicted metal-binding protein
VSCLAELRKRRGTFTEYPANEPLDLVGIITRPGCPALTGPDKLLQRIRALTEFRVDAIHFSNCVKARCPFKKQCKNTLNEAFPKITIVIGTHQEHITPEESRQRVERLFCQPKKSMVDVILDKDRV